MFLLLCDVVRYDCRINNVWLIFIHIFWWSVHVLFTLFVSNTYCVFCCFVCLCLVFCVPMLPVSLDCVFLIYSNDYLYIHLQMSVIHIIMCKNKIAKFEHTICNIYLVLLLLRTFYAIELSINLKSAPSIHWNYVPWTSRVGFLTALLSYIDDKVSHMRCFILL
jgi:hypothetical protein